MSRRVSLIEGIQHSCGHIRIVIAENTWAYLKGDPVHCGIAMCSQTLDWPEVIMSSLRGAGATFGVLNAFGGRQISALVALKREKLITLDLREFGLPEGAAVRGFNLTGNSTGPYTGGMLRPAMLIENEFRRSTFPHLIQFYAFPTGRAPEQETFAMLIQYVEPMDDPSRQLLADAAFAHGDGDFRKAVIEAHTASDLALTSFAISRLEIAETKAERMSFGEKYKLIHRRTPALTAMGESLESRVVQLNHERNSAAHPRISGSRLSDEASARCLTTSLFILHMLEAAHPY